MADALGAINELCKQSAINRPAIESLAASIGRLIDSDEAFSPFDPSRWASGVVLAVASVQLVALAATAVVDFVAVIDDTDFVFGALKDLPEHRLHHRLVLVLVVLVWLLLCSRFGLIASNF